MSELKLEGLKDERQRMSEIDTGLEGRTREHTGEANSSGLDAYSVGDQTLGGIVRASDPLIFKKRLYHEPNGIALSQGYQWSTLIPGGTVKLFVVIKNVTFLVKMIKNFVFFYILMQWLSYHENPAARLRGIHVGPRQGPEPPANHP